MRQRARRLLKTALLLSGTALASSVFAPSAQAACVLAPTAGDDVLICTNDTVVGNLTDPGGNDRIEIISGTIDGFVEDQGAGTDTFIISGGGVTGNVQQGDGIDSFTMSGGVLGSLNQGGHFDTFFMSGGHIIGAFDDGDEATMTGGRIGRVDLKLADNIFRMSGGTIDNNLVAGFQNDTIILSGGTIGGNISVSGGTDSVTVTGGSVNGEVRMSAGTDSFIWNGGGVISGLIDLGTGDGDTATLTDLTSANIGGTAGLSGGTGTGDTLTMSNVKTNQPARFDSWEVINLTNGTELSFTGAETLVLGDAGTTTGQLNLGSGSTLFGGGAMGGISGFGGTGATFVNAGLIDLTNGGNSASDRFTVTGNYTGDGGAVRLNTVLGDDASASDRLVIRDGAAAGTTGLTIVNTGGSGAATQQNGIMVVETANATTSAGAFSLTERVAAGAFEYSLFRGGVTPGTEENWYLRSAIVAPPPGIAPTAPPAPPPSSGGTPVVAPVVPLYRLEVPAYAAIPPVAQELALAGLGTFHERRGAQPFLRGEGSLTTAWGRLFGQDMDLAWSGTVMPGFDGSLFGFQAGQDVFARESDSGHRDRFGLFAGYAQVKGDVSGQALGWNGLAIGDMTLGATSLGGYWTHIGPEGWYVDAVLMGSWFDGETRVRQGETLDISGTAITASLEGGYPIALTDRWTLEPQGQFIWQKVSLKDRRDRFSAIAFANDDLLVGRLGARLEGAFPGENGMVLKPYIKANIWHRFDADQTTRFDADSIVTEIGGTSLEIGGGVTAMLNERVSLFATADYTTNLGGEKHRVLEGNLGLTVQW